jgi:FkbM family methyltransferase
MEISIGQYESLRPKAQVRIDEHKLEFVVPNRIIAWRVKTILTKEPETIKWLKKIQRDDIFFDIGANIGLYSIFAAVCQGADVYGFEPESQNYSIFLKNIVLNNLSSRVTAFGLAISNNIMIDRLFLSEFLWDGGQSCHSFGERVGPNLEERHSKVVQGCVSWTLDDLIEKKYVPIPRFIKIDVDGFEHRVIDGAKKTLENKKVESICIEINPKIKEHAEIVPLMRDLGFEYDRQQVSKSERITGPFVGCAEYIFYRPEIKRVFVRLPFDGGVLAGDNINKDVN